MARTTLAGLCPGVRRAQKTESQGRSFAVGYCARSDAADLIHGPSTPFRVCGRDADRIEQSAAHPQKAHLRRQAQAQGRSPSPSDRAALGRREGEERLELEAAQIARQPPQAQVRGVPVVQIAPRKGGTIAELSANTATY